MNEHLSHDELIDAAEARLDHARRGHVDACATCHRAVADLAAVLDELETAVPEPSPLFWDHLSQRIRHATADERAGRPTGWLSGWRPVAAAGAMAAVVALAIAVRTAPVKDTRALPASVVSDVSTGASSDDAVWTSMEQMAARLSPDDVHALVATPPELIPTVSDLSAKEREVFVTLLGSELNGDVQ